MGETKTLIGSVPTYMGTWQSGKEYSIDNVVSSDGNAYISLIENNTAALTDTNAWAVFVQGLNGIMVEAAVGKQKVISAVAACGVDVDSNISYDELSKTIHDNLTGKSDMALYERLGYSEDAIDHYRDYYHDKMLLALEIQEYAKNYNIATWKDSFNYKTVTFFPMVDTSGVSSGTNFFNGCAALKAIPMLDFSSTDSFNSMFYECSSLQTIPPLDTSKVTNMSNMCYNCSSLQTIPPLDTSKVTNFNATFSNCKSLNTVALLDLESATNANIFNWCTYLVTCHLTNLKISLSLQWSPLLTPESVAFIVSHAANTSAITITLHATAYANAIADAEVQAALEAHPLVTLASA